MTNRELLEMAAKAAGIEVWFPRMNGGKNPDGTRIILTPCHTEIDRATVEWNPLDDDGDAFRLAVKLRISLIHEQEYMGGPVVETLEATTAPCSADGDRHVATECLNELGVEEFSAARRAIVRAAAALESK